MRERTLATGRLRRADPFPRVPQRLPEPFAGLARGGQLCLPAWTVLFFRRPPARSASSEQNHGHGRANDWGREMRQRDGSSM